VARCIQPILIVVLLLTAAVARAADNAAADPAGVEFFEKKIRPLFVQHCYECHSAKSEEIKAHLLLDTRASSRAATPGRASCRAMSRRAG
jgi:hypothetical protein